MEKVDGIIDFLYAATSNGKIIWTRDEPDLFTTEVCGEKITIEFLYPMLADETSSGSDIAQITLQGVFAHYFSGTVGMNKIVRMLMISNDSLRDWNNMCDENALKTLEWLKSSIDLS